MPRPRFLKLDPERQAHRFVECGEGRICRESGFEQASYNRIIERAGLSKGAMYYYFDDKLDLYVTVLEVDSTRRWREFLGIDDDVDAQPETFGRRIVRPRPQAWLGIRRLPILSSWR